MKIKQETFLRSLLSGSSIRQAAQVCQVSERQAHRWLSDDAFKRRLHDEQETLNSQVSTLLLASSTEAIETLRELMDSAYPPAIRRSAAHSLLELRLRWIDAIDLERRLSELEALSWQR